MRFYIIILFVIGNMLSGSIFAQKNYTTKSKKAIKHFEEALRYYSAKRNTEALEILSKALKADENFVEAHMVSGDCYSDLGNLEAAIVEYQKVVDLAPGFLSTSYKQLADAQFKTGDYQSALINYKLFTNKKRVHPKVMEAGERSLKNAEFGVRAIKTPVPFEPKNLGPTVNTDQYEYFPVLTADESTLVFTRNYRKTRAMDLQEDFYVSFSEEGEWSVAKNIGEPINTDDNEGAQTITADGNQLFFTGCNRKEGKGSCDIYYAVRHGNRWGKPLNLDSPVNSKKWESQPSISADGKTLYFASNRQGSLGGADIWVTHLAPNGEWTVPRNLGEKINTAFAEETPFIHPDGKTLYFTSNGHVGMGEKDIYMTRMDENGMWSTPKNLGYPINTWKDEMGLFVAASGETAYFSSDREGGLGKLDLYSFVLYQDARPTKVTYVKGRVKDKVTGRAVGATFELIDLATSEVVVRSSSDKLTGNFLVTLPVNHDYALNVSKDGYLFYSDHFSLIDDSTKTESYKMDVKLQPIKYGEKVVLKNIFFETASYELLPESKIELGKLVDFLNNNPNIRIEIGGHTDNIGKPAYNQLLSENRAKAVREYLVRNNVDAARTLYKGYGETEPINTNDTPEGRANNRRTEFTVLGNE